LRRHGVQALNTAVDQGGNVFACGFYEGIQ